MTIPQAATVQELGKLVNMEPVEVMKHVRRAHIHLVAPKKYPTLEFLQAVDRHQTAGHRAKRADHLKAFRFKPGQSGNANGRPKGKSVTTALRAIVETNGMAKQLAETAVEHALAGDYRYFAGVLDRLEGKVPLVVAAGELPELTPEEAVQMQASLLETAGLAALDYEADPDDGGTEGKTTRRKKTKRSRAT